MTREAWMSSALCAEIATDVFFPEKGDHATAKFARKICAACPVKALCADYAKRNHIRYGIFGGIGARTRNLA